MKKIIVLLGFCFLSCVSDVLCNKDSQVKVENFLSDCCIHRECFNCKWDLPVFMPKDCRFVSSLDGNFYLQVYFTPAESLGGVSEKR